MSQELKSSRNIMAMTQSHYTTTNAYWRVYSDQRAQTGLFREEEGERSESRNEKHGRHISHHYIQGQEDNVSGQQIKKYPL